nr:DNA internalization-related competence protein ComEC/Rec2 [uncultured Microbulbifer sp.]
MVSVLLWALAVGIGQVAFWPGLPGSVEVAGWLLLSALAAGVLLLVARPSERRLGNLPVRLLLLIFLCFLFGTCWALLSNHKALAQRLPESLHGTDHRITLTVTSLPQLATAVSSFSSYPRQLSGFQDARFEAEIRSGIPEMIGARLRLSWYRLDAATAKKLRAGSQWEMTVRVKQPRGSVNPHTYDFEGWLLQRGISATGYVRDKDVPPRFIAPGEGLARIREQLREKIAGGGSQGEPLKREALIRALLLGDRGGVDRDTQALLRRTGTAHLLAISGLHVGMVAGFFLLVGGLMGRGVGLMRGGSPVLYAGVAAFLGALGYTLVSGAPLSAQRALIMTGVGIVALLSRRRINGSLGFALALALVLLLQPLAVLNAGFWLSFIAVGALLLRFHGRVAAEDSAITQEPTPALAAKIRIGIRTAVQSQWAILLALLLPSVMIFAGVSVSGFLLNLIAIPWVGLVILPLILLGALVPAPVSSLLLVVADANLGWLLNLLAVVDTHLPGWQAVPAPSLLMIGIVAVCGVVLLLPRGIPGRALAWCLVPALLSAALPWQRTQEPAFALTVLDVGQGLSVVAATETHSMVFDTGASSGSGWNAGASIVAPYLLATSGSKLDLLAVSHGDLDHSGGTEGVLAQLHVAGMAVPGRLAQRLAGEESMLQSTRCIAGSRIDMGEMAIEWLWPRSQAVSGEENDHSCVALVTWRDVRVLLTGDISRNVERQLAAENVDFEPVDLLVAPHHGSRTSSSAALIGWASPARVVFSAGYRHHFGHPHQQVVARYQAAGAVAFSTAESGAIRFFWDAGAQASAPDIAEARAGGRFWYASHSNKKDNNQTLSQPGELW